MKKAGQYQEPHRQHRHRGRGLPLPALARGESTTVIESWSYQYEVVFAEPRELSSCSTIELTDFTYTFQRALPVTRANEGG